MQNGAITSARHCTIRMQLLQSSSGLTESKRLWVGWTWTWEYQNDCEPFGKTKTALFLKNTTPAAFYYSASIIIWPWMFVSVCVLHNRPDSDQMFPCKPPWIAHMVSDCSCTLQPLLHSALLPPCWPPAPRRGVGAHVSDYQSYPRFLPEADGDSLWASCLPPTQTKAPPGLSKCLVFLS